MLKESRWRRKKYIVDRHFQVTFITRMVGIVAASVLLSFISIITYYLSRYVNGDTTMRLFYVSGLSNSGIKETSLLALVVPALVVSAILSVVFSLIIGLLYSHRIAGPLYNLRRAIINIRNGKLDQIVRFRKKDEFHVLAMEMTKTIAWLKKRMPSNESRNQ